MKYKLTSDSKVINGHTLFRIQALKRIDCAPLRVPDEALGGYVETLNNLSQEGNCWVSDNACVYGGSTVKDDALVCDNAMVQVGSTISGRSFIGGRATVTSSRCEDNSTVHSSASISSSSLTGKASVLGKASVYMSHLSDNSMATESAIIRQSILSGDSKVFGKAVVENAYVGHSARVGGSAVIRHRALEGCTYFTGNALVEGPQDYVYFGNVGTEQGTLTAYRTEDGSIEFTRGCFSGSAAEFLAASAAKHDSIVQAQYITLVQAAMQILTRVPYAYNIS